MENTDTSFEEFDAAFNDADEYQNDTSETVETEEAPNHDDQEETTDLAVETPEAEEDSEDSEDPAEDPDNPGEPEQFILKVNKEERTVSREEVIALAQKGADYDRVKDQLAESKNTIQQMTEQYGKYQSAIDALEMLASASGASIEQVVETMHLGALMKDGKTEAEAKAELRALKAEAQLKSAKDKESAQKSATEESKARADKEVAEFRKKYPSVDLSEDLCKELMPDVHAGMSLVEAYQKRELAKKDSELEEMNRRLEAERQNKKNRSTAVGSQRDSGGRREKSDFDDFMTAFE